jgi:hypothetical protein
VGVIGRDGAGEVVGREPTSWTLLPLLHCNPSPPPQRERNRGVIR